MEKVSVSVSCASSICDETKTHPTSPAPSKSAESGKIAIKETPTGMDAPLAAIPGSRQQNENSATHTHVGHEMVLTGDADVCERLN